MFQTTNQYIRSKVAQQKLNYELYEYVHVSAVYSGTQRAFKQHTFDPFGTQKDILACLDTEERHMKTTSDFHVDDRFVDFNDNPHPHPPSPNHPFILSCFIMIL